MFQASAPARIINVSSSGHDLGHARKGICFDKVSGHYKYLRGYHVSKLANVLHANELARNLQGSFVVNVLYVSVQTNYSKLIQISNIASIFFQSDLSTKQVWVPSSSNTPSDTLIDDLIL